ncbi:MAG: RPA family protein [Thermoplasmata archaeon]
MSMIQREVAWRIFAREFNDSTLEIEGEKERSPSYLITPLGAQVNRLYAVGVLTEIENKGTPEEPLWRARVTDPTGTFFISAGQYQPNVATTLANMEPPLFVAVVGKVNTYQPDDETFLTSVRAELVKEATEEQRDYWILEAARGLKERIELASEAKKMEEVSTEELIELGYDKKLASGIKKSKEHYPSVPLEKYERMLEDSLRYVLPEYESTSLEDVAEEESEEKDEELEELVLEIIENMEEGENGVQYEEVMNKAMKEENISQDDFEEVVNDLRSSGKIYEPVLGNLKRIY